MTTGARDSDFAADAELRALLEDTRAEDAATAAQDADALSALRAGVREGVAAEDARLGATIRQQPFRARVALALLTVTLAVVGMWQLAPRADAAHYPTWRLFLEAAVYLVVAALGIAAAARGVHRPPLSTRAVTLLGAASVVIVVAVALMPAAHDHGEHVSRGMMEMISPCTFVGLGLALPCYVLFRLIARGSRFASIAAAAAAGLAANALLHMHCPMIATEHVILSHAAMGLWVLLGGVCISQVEASA